MLENFDRQDQSQRDERHGKDRVVIFVSRAVRLVLRAVCVVFRPTAVVCSVLLMLDASYSLYSDVELNMSDMVWFG